MMRPHPLLLIFDEPTSALDAHSEHALFGQYALSAPELGDTVGAITVVVSHRFSTVKVPDLIVVIGEGRIVEQGTHAELIERGATYAELYELQASAFA